MNATTVHIFGGPHDGGRLLVSNLRPVVFLPMHPEQLCLYTTCQGTPKAEYVLVDGRYVFTGVRKPPPA